ncbi:hypothetical protein [Williamwhitmania taraxaci]|uniref:Uncharacterized protein n=1 Tax=Williamwhitmania taraxaci TaxID=1640674 RepID=A0A1G6P024_9BACT|nr:hypothetical protein [Williamwhitmania taraxaci]SDC73271.1 hypothetical protein SAMN05216323_104715 [Williamwhitmania taraxaci]
MEFKCFLPPLGKKNKLLEKSPNVSNQKITALSMPTDTGLAKSIMNEIDPM